MTQQKRGAQQVRIIGGKWKGRKLRFSGNSAVRPTPSRVRETLFNWLRSEITGARCLDAFAGSGVLGFEALSQGAAVVTFVEQNPRSAQAIRSTAALLDAQAQCSVVRSDIAAYLRRSNAAYDVVFLDPPFDQPQLLERTLRLLTAHQSPGTIYAEAPSLRQLESLAARCGLQVSKRTSAGDAHGVLLQHPGV